jgi:hypothetical protein
MKNIFEIPTPPAARVVSVGTLRSIEASIELDGFTDQTLAEVQHVASHVTDDGAEVLVSIVVETDTHRETGQAEVPFEWFESQIRMRSILNSPNDISTALNHTEKKPSVCSSRPKIQLVQLVSFGRFLAQSWNHRARKCDHLVKATTAWLDLVQEFKVDAVLGTSDEIRLLLGSQSWSKSERRRIAAFCSATISQLLRT